MGGFVLFALALVMFALLMLTLSVKVVPQGMEYTVERFGRYAFTLRPGLGIIIPMVYRIGHKINMMETTIDILSQKVTTKDNAEVTVDAVVFFQITDAAKAAYDVSNLGNAIMNLVMTNIRNVMGSINWNELASKRDEINASLLSRVEDATHPWGVKINRVEIKDIIK